MEKLFIYGGITIGSLIGAYVPVWLFNTSAFSLVSIVGGVVGSIVGLWVGYRAMQNFND
jgi:uncharacterized membrane protein YeaQ/YmgE (transglycosylase-associated protein family)